MSTLRIDVHGQRFEVTLPPERVTVGSGPDADLRLEAEGIAHVHCTLEPLGENRIKVKDADSGLPTVVKGSKTKQASVRAGDTIELGPARLTVMEVAHDEVVVMEVPAPAAPPPPPPRAAPAQGGSPQPAATPRVRREPAASKGVPGWAIAVGALVAVGLIAFFAISGNKQEAGPGADAAAIEEALEAGRLDEAEEALAQAQAAAETAGASAARREALEVLSGRLASTRSRLKLVLESIWPLRRDLDRGLLAQRREDVERSFGDAGRKAFDDFAARVREDNTAWLASRVEALDAKGEQLADFNRYGAWLTLWDTFEQSLPTGVDGEAAIAAGRQRVVDASNEAGEALQTRIRAKLDEGLAFQAVELLERRIEGYVGVPIHAALAALLAEAEAEKARPFRPDPAIPSTADAGGPDPTAPHDPTPRPPSRSYEDVLSEAKSLTQAPLAERDFAGAGAALAPLIKSLEPGIARAAVSAWAGDLKRAAATFDALVAHMAEHTDAYKRIPVSSRMRVRVLRADKEGFAASVRGGESRFLWKRVAPSAWEALLERWGPEAGAAVGAACVLRALRQVEASEAWLVRAGSSGADTDALFQTLARWRDEAVPAGGYVIHAGRYVTPEERDRIVRERRIVEALLLLEDKDEDKRRAAYATLLEIGEVARDRFVTALRLRRSRLIDTLAADKRWAGKKYKQRLFEELETRRAHALALIRDGQAYPYPNPTKMGQAEVEARVDQVRQVWERPFELIVQWNDKLKLALASVTEVDEVLVQIDPEHEPTLDALAKQVNGRIHMPAYTPTGTAEKTRRYSLDVLAFNLKVPTTAQPEERDNVLAVNEYRMMMGMHAVKIHERLVRGARGHSRHMRENGYFEHNVPANKGATAQNKTPGARAKQQGYGGGVGENIAMGPGTGRAAFKAWFGSSGHHRNMLGGWTDMGCGANGRSYWTQLFGGMTGKSLKLPDKLPDPDPFFAPD